MSEDDTVSRRQVMALGAAATTAAVLGFAPSAGGAPAPNPPQVPRRVLGKTKEKIPILLLGGGMGFSAPHDPRVDLALRHGVNYIDTARSYAHGASERNAGLVLDALGVRDKVWITSKTPNRSAPGVANDVAFSLETLKTTWVDLYFLHGLDDVAPLDDPAVEQAVSKLKAEKKIRFFGFSTHSPNVVELLHKAAARPFVDAVMFKYNFREYGNRELNAAMDAAHKAGVGLIAMKTQGAEAGLADGWKKYEKTGKWTKHQAVLKAVWDDPRITAAVSHMTDVDQVKANIAAAVDKAKLGAAERGALQRYARATRAFTCDGCDALCNPAVTAPVQVGTTLRALMYHDAYGDAEKGRAVFRRLPLAARQYDGVDFSGAERACPHGVQVTALMTRARQVLG